MQTSISVLHEDLLWTIFLMNTHIDFTDDYHDFPNIPSGLERPLTVARHCSQVCRQWRLIVLSSSSIWARLIDLDGLRQIKDEWRTEVVARSGGAPLWVYGEVELYQDFPYDFLKRNWERIERLLITDNGRRRFHSQPTSFDRQTKWAFLKEPAPQLKSIRLNLHSYSNPLPSGLLSDDCPLLRSIGVFQAFHKFSINSPWLRNLSSVMFSYQFTTAEVIHALQKMPELVSLTVFNRGGMDEPVSDLQLEFYPKISLPKLRLLTLEGTHLPSANTILRCVTPSPHCALVTAWMGMPNPGFDYEDYEQYEKEVTSHIVPYFSMHPPTAIAFHFAIDEDRLFLESPSFTRFGGPPKGFSIELCSSHLRWSCLAKELINSPSFSQVTTLHMPIFTMYDTNGAVPGLIDIFKTLSSVRTLCAADGALHHLLDHYDRERTAALFPALVKLKLIRPPQTKEERDRREEVPAHERFLHLRKDVGRPIAILELGFILELQRDRDHLESELPGLLVKWSTISTGGERCPDEYRCGDEKPEKLRFSRVIENLNLSLYRGE